METVRKTVTIMPIVILVETITFVCLVSCGIVGDPMTAFGLILLVQLLFTRRLSKFYEKYGEHNDGRKDGSQPQYICRWSFEPLDLINGSTDDYIDKLLKFLVSPEGEIYIPDKTQRFGIWWESEHFDECHMTSRVTKMTHQADGQILIETTSGYYIGQASFNIDLAVAQDLCLNDREDDDEI